jgi:peptide/nickel transport system substrate-binding protein
MSRNKKEADFFSNSKNTVRRRIRSFKPKKDTILSPGFEIRKVTETVYVPPSPTKRKKRPTIRQWKYFFSILSFKEKVLFSLFTFLTIASVVIVLTSIYYKNTKTAPAEGGTFIEGVLEQPRFVNPIYANSDIDRDLSELIFSGLMKYDKNMQIIPDLAENYPEIQDDGRTYNFFLKNNVIWQDGISLTADDVVFTVKTIQSPEFKSPYLANWVGVKVEKINDFTVKFTLQKPYSAFLENCTLKIMPKHIWETVPAESFSLQSYNLENTIGSGMYKIKEVKRDNQKQVKSIKLVENNSYFGQKPYIPTINFVFSQNQQELVRLAQKGKIMGLGSDDLLDLGENWQKSSVFLPRYFAVFFNQGSNILSDKEIRTALNYGTNKKELSESIVNSPLLPDFYGLASPEEIYQFDPEKAKQILENDGYKDIDGDGLREKVLVKKFAFQFEKKIQQGSSGNDVTELQKCLKIEETGYFGPQTKEKIIKFQQDNSIESNGIVGTSTRKKLNEICFGDPQETKELKIVLITVDQQKLEEVAETLKRQWKEIGVNLEIQTYSIYQLEQEFIKSRNYDALLFGEVLGAIPDPFPFWHSSQKNDPGLNLCSYDNKIVDDLLEENRKNSDPIIAKEKLEAIQNAILKDAPAVFLYSPEYIYSTSSKVNGIENKKAVNPSKRFIDIANWYLKTKRIWK